MVAILVRLKLALLRNSLERSLWRTVGLVLGIVYALGVVVLALAGLVALRWTSPALTGDVTVLAFSVVTLGWLLFSLLVFGVDETVDPAKFALLPVRARDLQPGLLVAGLLSSPGLATVLVAAGLVLAWARTPLWAAAALVALPLGVVTCFLVSRAATAAFASFLGSRRFRDLAFVLLALFGVGFGIAANLFGALFGGGPEPLRAALGTAARIAGWTPFGWAWALPAEVAAGRWASAAGHLGLALALVWVLWRVWGHFLDRRLTEPVEGGGEAVTVRRGTVVDRLFPPTPAGAVAGRTLRYWRRDPRYLAGVAGFLIAPVILIVSQLANPGGSNAVAAFAPVLLGLLLGMSLAQDLCYDGSAVWQHVVSGVRGRDDRAGRVLSTLTVFAPMLVVLVLVAMAFSGRWSLLPVVLGLTVGFVLVGLGVGCYVGALWQWPAPPPGTNPFQKGSSGGLPAFLSFSVSSLATLVLTVPMIGLAVGSIWVPWLGWLTLVVGAAVGAVVLWAGIVWGGRRLDAHWPEVLTAVSERSG